MSRKKQIPLSLGSRGFVKSLLFAIAIAIAIRYRYHYRYRYRYRCQFL